MRGTERFDRVHDAERLVGRELCSFIRVGTAQSWNPDGEGRVASMNMVETQVAAASYVTA